MIISPMSPPESADNSQVVEKVYTVGTLRYNQPQLFMLFFWLMWNDFSLMLLEDLNLLRGVQMRDHGATFTQMALLGTIGGLIIPFINPWVSTWSDRHRGKYGRRRPFLLFATPFVAFFFAATPFMPDFYQYLLRFPLLKPSLSHLPMNGEALFIGVCGQITGVFNAVVMAIFSYFYWDVVPESHMGRFQSVTKNVTLVSGLVWSFWIYGTAEHHMKEVHVITAGVCVAIYLTSIWRVKEGGYPAPDVHKKGGMAAPVRAYFVECFKEPYYLWIFVASMLFQVGNIGISYRFYYIHYDLKLDLATIGWSEGWSKVAVTGFGVLFGFAVGSLTDRLKPVRLMGPCCLVAALVQLGSFFIVCDKWTYLVSFCLSTVTHFVFGIVTGAFIIEIFPREKLGQFCSAQAVFYQIVIGVLHPVVAMLFDYLKNNRLGFFWTFIFYGLAAAAYTKVHFNWKERHGQTPVPHAG